MGKACTFFGHHDCPSSIKPKLREVLIDLIENRSVDMFYVGNKGAFDRLVHSVLRELVQEYPRINYAVVLERMPGKQNDDYPEDFSDTMLPEGIEEAPPRFAIVWRNKWIHSYAPSPSLFVPAPDLIPCCKRCFSIFQGISKQASLASFVFRGIGIKERIKVLLPFLNDVKQLVIFIWNVEGPSVIIADRTDNHVNMQMILVHMNGISGNVSVPFIEVRYSSS